MRRFIFPSLMILGMLGITVFCEAIQVDGYCYLENQTIHDGTRVLFEADTPGAVTDSVFTDSAGYYQIDVAVGGYDVYFSHEGFRGDSLIDRLLTAPTTLPSVTLVEMPHGIYISGALSGYLEDTTYVLADQAWVAEGDSLVIEAGAILYFLGDTSAELYFRINGYLSAIGTESDSIKFLAYPGFPSWWYVSFWESEDTSRMEFCLFSGFELSGIRCDRTNPQFANCLITNNYTGISCYYCQPHFSYCTINGNSVYQINIANDGNAIFDHCLINDSPYEGVWCTRSEPTFINCTITGNTFQGIRCMDTTTAVIVNTMIVNNGAGISFEDSPDVSILYCDFYGNTYGNFTGDPPPYLGQIAGVNNNGDPCDIFHNIFLDPMLTGNYHLQAGSPCIDAGDPTYPYDPDSTIADIGAFFFDQSSVNDPCEIPNLTEFRLYPNYPNPFNASTTISFDIPVRALVRVEIYNILGQQITTLLNRISDPGVYHLTWKAEDSPSGIYFVQLTTPADTQTIKTVLFK